MTLIDTHCHLYLKEFAEDIETVIERAQAVGINRFYLPAIDSEVIPDMLALEARYPGICVPMMGLHPCSVKENYLAELTIVEGWLGKRDFVAIGEIGLDYYWDKSHSKEQLDAFNLQMQWALNQSKPIVIHTRNAMAETIAAVKPFADKGLVGIFHCFGGTLEEAKQIIDMGFYLGIGGVVTYKKAGLAETLENIGLEHLVLETDAPYLSPVPFRGKRNESSYLKHILTRISEIKGVSVEEVAAITTQNAEKIFGC